MQVSVETTEGLGRKMVVALPAEDIDSAVDERLRSLSKTTRINGFRPGKVPFKVVKKRYEPQVRSEVLGSLINRSYFEAIQQENLRPAGQPQIEPDESVKDEGEGFQFIATFEVYPEFEPVFNDQIQVNRPTADIGDSDIDDMLESLRTQRAEFVDVDRAAADKDQVVIDFLGRVDGEEFEGGAADNAPLVLGSGQMIEGFETQIIGMSKDEKRTINVTFPEGYQAEHLAGKEAEFDITVQAVKESKIPEMSEEFVKSFGIEDGNIEGLRADIRKNMERELNQRIDSQIKSQVMDGLLELNPISIPAALVGEEVDRLRQQMMEQMPAETDASFLGEELFKDQAERRVRLGLVVGEIIQRNEIAASDEAVRAKVESLASSYDDPTGVIDYYYSNPEYLKNVEGLVLEETVTSTVLAAATIADEPTTFKELMNPPPATPEEGEASAETV